MSKMVDEVVLCSKCRLWEKPLAGEEGICKKKREGYGQLPDGQNLVMVEILTKGSDFCNHGKRKGKD